MAEFDIGHVLFAAADKRTGAITCSIGDVKSGEGIDNDATVFQSWGWLAIPAPPIAGVSAAEAVILKTGDADIVVGGRSVRSASIAGLIQPGESCGFADGSQACTLWKLDGSVIHYTTHDNTATGRAVSSIMSPTDGFSLEWPWGRHRFDQTGLHVDHASGATLDLGSIAAPAPLDAFSTYFAVTAKMMRFNASFMTVGADAGVYSPVAKADATVTVLSTVSAALSSVNTAMVAVQAALASLGAIGVNSAAGATITAAGVAVGAATSAIASATAAVTAGAVGTTPVPGPIGSQSLAVT